MMTVQQIIQEVCAQGGGIRLLPDDRLQCDVPTPLVPEVKAHADEIRAYVRRWGSVVFGDEDAVVDHLRHYARENLGIPLDQLIEPEDVFRAIDEHWICRMPELLTAA